MTNQLVRQVLASLRQERNLEVLSKIAKVPRTRPGLREALSKFGTPPTSSLGQMTRGMQQRAGGQGPTNVTMNPTITIHGVPAGKEEVVANKVKRAMEDPIKFAEPTQSGKSARSETRVCF